MADSFDPKLKDGLRRIIKKSGVTLSSTVIIKEFHKPTINRNVLKTLNDIVKHDSIALHLFEIDADTNATNLKTYTPKEWLERYLEKYVARVQARKEAAREASRENTSNRAQPSRSTDPITQKNVSEIMKKVVKAASGGLSKSAQSTFAAHLISHHETMAQGQLRPHSQWYFNRAAIESLPLTAHPPNCAALPIETQEQLLIDDLLYLFIGIPGTYIKPVISLEADTGFAPITFRISDQVDVSLRDIVKELLPLASYYSIIQKFAQWGSHVNNQIVQALSATLQTIINDYYVSIIQLETEQTNKALSLHKLLYLIRPNMQALEILSDTVIKIGRTDLVGGKILSLLYDEISLLTGDVKSQAMIVELTEKASIPYIEMLELWILKGVIIDTYNQFFVVDHGIEINQMQIIDDDTARYWESRYTIHRDRIPRFLENDADIILRTGKYLNVIRQCGKQLAACNELTKLEFSPRTQYHSEFIKKAYYNASKTLLELLMNENDLMGHITSVKRYFLLQQGDLITQFMDASEEELAKNVDKVAPVRLDNLLQLIVRISSAKHDPYVEDLHCDLFTMDLATQMSKIHIAGNNDYAHYGENSTDSTDNIDLSGLECFVFQYNVQWPVSIVLNQWALSQYQMLFRLLFYCKHVERQLCKVWIENTRIRKSTESNEMWRCANALRQRMLNAIQHLENYMMIEVIEPNWHIFTEKMKSVQNVDDVMSIHQDFLHICLQNCMLNYPDLLRPVMNMCNVCLKFCKFIQVDPKAEISITWTECVDAFSKEFTDNLIDLLKRINDLSMETTTGARLINLVCRINFNSFYSEELENNATKENDAVDASV